MIKKEIKLNYLFKFLNDLLKTDRKAIENLFSIRVSCNKKLAYHKTVQVMAFGKNRPGKERQVYLVGIIGILNGLIGSFGTGNRRGWGCLSMTLEGNKIKKFEIIKNK